MPTAGCPVCSAEAALPEGRAAWAVGCPACGGNATSSNVPPEEAARPELAIGRVSYVRSAREPRPTRRPRPAAPRKPGRRWPVAVGVAAGALLAVLAYWASL